MEVAIMKIVVIGGSGLIGSKLVPKLRERGHEAIAASPKTGVNSITGEGQSNFPHGNPRSHMMVYLSHSLNPIPRY